MLKVVDPCGWDWERPVAQLVKVSSRGLVGNDRSDFIKSAGSAAPVFLDAIDKIKVAEDEVPVHLLALGASEAYGPNRNGDGFKEATCRKYHDTFVKHARMYRNHRNKDPRESYGVIKASAYNEDMRRVELLVVLNGSEKAAQRNGGKVADSELEKLASKEDIPVSMACRVPFDVCSGCGNKARSRDEYCTAETCKYGGCRDNLTKIAEDGHILHVDNPDPLWFDISHVFRPADRIAYGTKADWLEKAAAHAFLPGALAAELLGVTAPSDVHLIHEIRGGWNSETDGRIKLAHALAFLENDAQLLPREALRALDPVLRPPLSCDRLLKMGAVGSRRAAEHMCAMADCGIILPIREFATWIGKEASWPAAAQRLPRIYNSLLASGLHGDLIARNSLGIAVDVVPGSEAVKMARAMYDDWSLLPDAVSDRAMRHALASRAVPNVKNGIYIGESFIKQAAQDESSALALSYALYKLAALHRAAAYIGDDFELTARLAIGQNRVW